MAVYPQFWLIVIAGPFVSLGPDFFLRLAQKVFFPSPVDKVMYEQKYNPHYEMTDDVR